MDEAVARWRGEGERMEEEEEVRAVLSDICSVQGVKRVICHLIENLCVVETEIRKHTFPSHARSLLLFVPTG